MTSLDTLKPRGRGVNTDDAALLASVLTVGEAAALLGLNRKTVERWAKERRITSRLTDGGYYLIPRVAVQRYGLHRGVSA